MSRRERDIDWKRSGDPQQIWEARVEGESWKVRANAPAAEHVYSLVIDDRVVETFDVWPSSWTRPAPDKQARDREDLGQRREMQLEQEKFERTKNVKPSSRVRRAGEQARLPIRNDNDHAIAVIVEPWGEKHMLEPGSSVQLIGRGPRGQFEVSTSKDGVTVYAWSGATVSVLRDGVDVAVESKETPSQ